MGMSRSENMAKIRSSNTGPELRVRRALHQMGYRYRLHVKDLPGKPDIVFPGRKKIIFVHGCFWHQHKGCAEGRIPASRREYWIPKLSRTVARDAAHLEQLKKNGWELLVLWDCEIRDNDEFRTRISKYLGPRKMSDGT
jgi:DNA mismatch endonuclease (patch repair protein)